MNAKQLAALQKLEAAFLECKKAGLVFAGIDQSLEATVRSPEFNRLRDASSSCEAVLRSDCRRVETHGAYLDSGGA